MAGYFHYFSFGLSSYIDGLLLRIREEVFQLFVNHLAPRAGDTILDVGVSADDHAASNHLEKRYPNTERLYALSVEHLPDLPKQFKGLKVVEGDGRALPFGSSAFDFVHSHAVIEHVGGRRQQAMFLKEALRVARKGVLITTPNRWHPVESHTGLPLLHYLPAPAYRAIYRFLGKRMYATEETLNLLGSNELSRIVREVALPAYDVRLEGVRWLGIRSNLVMMIRKSER